MWRYFEENGNYRWIDIIGDLINSYNNSYHRSIKTTPNKVNSKNESKIYVNLYGHKKDVVLDERSIDLKEYRFYSYCISFHQTCSVD